MFVTCCAFDSASLPGPISGRNRVWRKTIIDAIRNDPEWKDGEYSRQPPSLRTANAIIYFMGSNPVLRQEQAPTLEKADTTLDAALATMMQTTDANDVLYQIGASWDYDPAPKLETIRVPLVAVNSADDLINHRSSLRLLRDQAMTRGKLVSRTDGSLGANPRGEPASDTQAQKEQCRRGLVIVDERSS